MQMPVGFLSGTKVLNKGVYFFGIKFFQEQVNPLYIFSKKTHHFYLVHELQVRYFFKFYIL